MRHKRFCLIGVHETDSLANLIVDQFEISKCFLPGKGALRGLRFSEQQGEKLVRDDVARD
jgi:hypothetical protein